MIAERSAARRWALILGIVALVLVILVVVDVRRRGRTEPLPPETTAKIEQPAPDRAAPLDDSSHARDARDAPIFPFGRSTSKHRTDLTAYTAAARVFADGGSAEDAYRAQSPRGWRYQYPPLLAALLAPISGFSTKTQSLLFGLLTAALIILTLVEARAWWRTLERPGDERPSPLPLFIVIGAIAATALPALNTLQRGQVGVLVVLPLMTGFRMLWTSRTAFGTALGGVLLAFPAVLKFIPMMPVGIAFLMTVAATRGGASRRFVAGAAGLAAGILLFAAIVPAALIGPERTLDATRIFMDRVVSNPEFSHDWQFELHANRNQSLDSAAWKLVRTLTGVERVAADPLDLDDGDEREAGPPRWFSLGSMALRALLVLLAVAAALRLARDGVRGAFAGFGIACLATLVVSPVSWGHHFTMLLPTMLAVPAWLDARGRSGAALVFSFVLGGAVVVHYVAVDLAGPIGLLGLTSGALLGALVVFAWRAAAPPSLREGRSHTLRAAPSPTSAPSPW